MKHPHEMSFADFLQAAKPTAGVNRWPQLGSSQEVVSYSVYINGDVADLLSESATQHEYRDVALHALTEKLGLDPLSKRDNLKVAEILGVRHAYMTAVLEASMVNTLSDQAQRDYESLTDALNHPEIQRLIQEQKDLSLMIVPVLVDAEKAIGQPLDLKDAAGVSRGEIVARNEAFTVQSLGNGAVVAHENKRMESLPEVGDNVTVAYYRGKGQVFENIQNLQIGAVYVDQTTGDLAVNIIDDLSNPEGKVTRVVLFNSVALVSEFMKEYNLGKEFVEQAIEVRQANPKKALDRPVQTIESEPYIDKETGAIAFDYREHQIKFTAVFNDAQSLASTAKQFGASEQFIQQALDIQFANKNLVLASAKNSVERAWQKAAKAAGEEGQVKLADTAKGRYVGKVFETTDLHVIQDIGRGAVAIHDKRNLDKVPMLNERISVSYAGGRGATTVKEVSQSRDTGR